MLHKTAGIVLRTVRYGDTSVVINIFTELFGIQSYLVNGVRTGKAKTSRANLLQPANLLDLVVYHRENKNLQRISDFRLAYLYRSLYADAVKNSIALYTVELLDKTLRQPETHPELFWFISDALQWMDRQEHGTANLPLYITLRVAELLGFRFYGKYGHTCYLDLQEGTFVADIPHHPYFLDEVYSRLTDQLLHAPDLDALKDTIMDKEARRRLLVFYQDYYRIHIPGFTGLRSPDILHEVLE
jgi:DNA repair protein RecO (recombination protein O)